MVNWKWQGMQQLDCLYRSNPPILYNCIVQNELLPGMLMAQPTAQLFLPPPSGLFSEVPFPGGVPHHPIWNFIPPLLSLSWIPYPSAPLNFFPLPLLLSDVLFDLLSIICPLPLNCKLHGAGIFFFFFLGRDFCLSRLLLYSQHLALCASQSRHSSLTEF